VPQLDVATALRAARERAAGAVPAELLELHRDVGFASATL
jgi:hypothetical protein